jgi:amino acid transporter
MNKKTPLTWFRNVLIGKPRDFNDKALFHKISLVAILAWVGLGADGLSSSCYGPEETMKVLITHPAMALFVGLATVVTIGIICVSYSQIIELFPSGGGGYLVASKLLSPSAGVVSGSALLVDYVLTIAISITAGADALFSVFPESLLHWKLSAAMIAALVLTILNLRGVKESVVIWTPIFFVFLATHGFMILYGLFSHVGEIPAITANTIKDLHASHLELGGWKVAALLLTAYSLGAGSYTGIEAVSNGLPILRQPRVATGKKTMLYMGVSLSFMVGGLLLMYVLYHSVPRSGVTLNAILFSQITAMWPPQLSQSFLWIAMFSAASLLFIAAQAGFLDGPRVMANMALDRWLPARFAALSDRFVSQNGIVIMGASALILIWVSNGSVDWLVVLYSINVFITFSISQLGMVVHWKKEHTDEPKWRSKLTINALGFILTATILLVLSIMKFKQGGWITLVVTGTLIIITFIIKKHYLDVHEELKRLEVLLEKFYPPESPVPLPISPIDCHAKTAVIFVNGFNGLGVHTLLGVQRMFPGVFKNFIFAEVGVIDAGNFKGAEELDNLQSEVAQETQRYASTMNAHGQYAEAIYVIGTDIVSGALMLGYELSLKHPDIMFFGGQLVFERETYFTRLLHNFTVFTLQRSFFKKGLSFFVVPVRV